MSYGMKTATYRAQSDTVDCSDVATHRRAQADAVERSQPHWERGRRKGGDSGCAHAFFSPKF